MKNILKQRILIIISMVMLIILSIYSCTKDKDITKPVISITYLNYIASTNECEYLVKAKDEYVIKSIEVYKNDSLFYNFTSNDRSKDYEFKVRCKYSPNGIRIKLIVTDFGDNLAVEILDSFSQTVEDIDGNVYHTVKIGTQTWMVEDLKTTRYRNGTVIPNVPDNAVWAALTTGAYCEYMGANCTTYLYNWYAVNTGLLCPTGWHVPTDAEWTVLVNYLGGNYDAGGKLKEAGLSHWNSPNTGATNETGFTALPGGYRSSNTGTYYKAGETGCWWSNSVYDNNNAWYRCMYHNISSIDRGNNSKRSGYAIRCIKD
jgi:uncharacterized protein (TIGR02145 family)